MKSDQLKRILEIANKGGYHRFKSYLIRHYDEEDGNFIYAWAENETHHINEILFCPKFGRAYWGNAPWCFICGKAWDKGHQDESGHPCRHSGYCVGKFQCHQSKLGGMSVEERDDYMVEDLEAKKSQ